MHHFSTKLPKWEDYHQELLAKGIQFPLATVPCPKTGLLAELPPPPRDKKGWPWTEETEPNIYSKKTDWPKITIVTPSYNQGHFLEETIRSVLLQNYPNLEYIILDAGSNDESVAIIKKYERWLSYWISEKDRGQSHAINKGLSIADGEFWQWINSDDRYFPNVFYKTAEILLESGKDTLYGGVYESTDDGNTKYSRVSFNVSKSSMIEPNSAFNKDYYYKPEATILSVQLSKEVGGFREDFHNLFDGEFMLRYTEKCNYIYTDILLMHYRIHEQTKTIANSQRLHREYTKMLKENHPVGSIKWFQSLIKEAGFLSTDNQAGKTRQELLQLALRLIINSPYVFMSRAYWGLWRKILKV